MAQETNDSQKIQTEHGLVAFFDILGFKSLLRANTLKESLAIIDNSFIKALTETERIHKNLSRLKTFVISDSILVALPMEQAQSAANEAYVYLFCSFCQFLMLYLFYEGLPIRGAIAVGEFHIRNENNKIIFAGKPIVDACEMANAIDLSACVIVPASESNVLSQVTTDLFRIHATPRKAFPKSELYLLKYGVKDHPFAREKIIEMFNAHGKHLDQSSLSKVNNTIDFFGAMWRG